MNGRLLKSIQSINAVVEIDILGYPEALYIIQVKNKNWSATKKLVKAGK